MWTGQPSAPVTRARPSAPAPTALCGNPDAPWPKTGEGHAECMIPTSSDPAPPPAPPRMSPDPAPPHAVSTAVTAVGCLAFVRSTDPLLFDYMGFSVPSGKPLPILAPPLPPGAGPLHHRRAHSPPRALGKVPKKTTHNFRVVQR